jgi:plastocyanin
MFSIPLLFLAACGGDDGNTTPDGPPGGDAQVATVMETPCLGGEQAMMTDNGANAYMPTALTISVGQSVQFINSSNHNVAPVATMSDPGLNVGFGATKCLKFTRAGTFRFKCTPHSFMGMVTVN